MFGGKNDATVGISLEHGVLSLTYMKGGSIIKTVAVDLPENVADHGEVVSRNLFTALLRDTLKENGIAAKQVACVVPSRDVFIRNITMPRMTEEQVKYNIPFEFRDFIRGELKEYTFDYAYRPPLNGEEEGNTLNFLAVAVSNARINQMRELSNAAGLKLTKAVPEVTVFESLLSKLPTEEEQLKERCFLNLEDLNSRMLIYKNCRYKLVHTMDVGVRRVIQTVADEMNVDIHIAKTYLETKYQDCDRLPAVMNIYRDISIEILKGFNFYEVSDMTSRLKDVVLCGVGATIEPLVEILKERVNMDVLTMDELYPEYAGLGPVNVTAASLAVLL